MSAWQALPSSVFVSYSYDDESTKDELLARLPPHVRAATWPFEEPDPKKAVSNGIIEEIGQSDALIWIAGGASGSSLWVNFERDYARRRGRRVFAFDPETGELWEDVGSPIELKATVLFSPGQEAFTDELLRWMKEKRSFTFEGGADLVVRLTMMMQRSYAFFEEDD